MKIEAANIMQRAIIAERAKTRFRFPVVLFWLGRLSSVTNIFLAGDGEGVGSGILFPQSAQNFSPGAADDPQLAQKGKPETPEDRPGGLAGPPRVLC
jgi:hypothetical protein